MRNSANLPIVVIGAGGHASVLVDLLNLQKRTILAVIGELGPASRQSFSGITNLKGDFEIEKYAIDEVLLINGIGQIPNSMTKKLINERLTSLGYEFASIVASTAYVSNTATVCDGAQILHHAIINSGACLGAHCTINSRATIEHDCHIGEYSHVAPSATLCGGVKVGRNCFIGANATILPQIEIGDNSIIGAGTVVTSNVTSNLQRFTHCSYKEKVVIYD